MHKQLWLLCRLPLLSIFITFYIYCFGLVNCPKEWHWPARLLEPAAPLLRFLGVYLYLPLFSPNPPRLNSYMQVVIQYDDGSLSTYPYSPQFPSASTSQLYERFANLYFSGITGKKLAFYKDFARFVARRTNTLSRHPVAVRFVLSWDKISPPEEQIDKPLLPLANNELVFAYLVRFEDLQ